MKHKKVSKKAVNSTTGRTDHMMMTMMTSHADAETNDDDDEDGDEDDANGDDDGEEEEDDEEDVDVDDDAYENATAAADVAADMDDGRREDNAQVDDDCNEFDTDVASDAESARPQGLKGYSPASHRRRFSSCTHLLPTDDGDSATDEVTLASDKRKLSMSPQHAKSMRLDGPLVAHLLHQSQQQHRQLLNRSSELELNSHSAMHLFNHQQQQQQQQHHQHQLRLLTQLYAELRAKSGPGAIALPTTHLLPPQPASTEDVSDDGVGQSSGFVNFFNMKQNGEASASNNNNNSGSGSSNPITSSSIFK